MRVYTIINRMMPIGTLVAGKGGLNALDHFCDPRDLMAPGLRQRLYHWRIYPYSPGHRNRCCADQDYSGTQTVLTV